MDAFTPSFHHSFLYTWQALYQYSVNYGEVQVGVFSLCIIAASKTGAQPLDFRHTEDKLSGIDSPLPPPEKTKKQKQDSVASIAVLMA